MSDFANRWRGSKEEAIADLRKPSNAIRHLLVNSDGTYSIMGHVVCEHCDYCEAEGDLAATAGDPEHPTIEHPAKADPYENVGR